MTTDVGARGPSLLRIPEGDTRERRVCAECGFIAYENPKVVVGSVVTLEDRILLCRRAIEPRLGYWTLPAGYLELNESTAAGAARQAYEQARARIAHLPCALAHVPDGRTRAADRARANPPDKAGAGE